jgi:hypothetical protein
MDPLTTLYERLRQTANPQSSSLEPPILEDWLRFWNDEDSELGNLRNFEHWLSRRQAVASSRLV